MFLIGVTGSIGSGKSYFCKKLASKRGVKYISSDAMVHELYRTDNRVKNFISENFPEAISGNEIDRKKLGEILFQNKGYKKKLENFLYPILQHKRHKILDNFKRLGVKIAVVEIPLLFENNLEDQFDLVITVFCNKIIQKQRVLNRRRITEAKLHEVLKSQMPLHEKSKRTDVLVNSGRFLSTHINDIYSSLYKFFTKFYNIHNNLCNRVLHNPYQDSKGMSYPKG